MNAPLSHVVLGTNSMENAERFYTPLLAMLGWRRRLSDSSPDKLLWQPATATRPLFGVLKPFDRKPQQVGNGAMVALNAPDRLTVDAVYELALTLGASCDGPPGLRTHYHPNYYGAYFRDLDGNKLCVVCHLAPVTCASGMLSRAAMIENARSWIAAWNRRDVEAVLAGFHPDAVNRRANGTPYRRAKGTPFHDGARLIGHAPLRCARRREGGARPEARAAQSIF